jgi:hypothetical protein
MLLSAAATAALCGAATAAPPALSEGRELDPVARDFFLGGPGSPGATEDSAPAGPAAPALLPALGPSALSFFGAVHEAIVAKFSIPLGTVRPAGGTR